MQQRQCSQRRQKVNWKESDCTSLKLDVYNKKNYVLENIGCKYTFIKHVQMQVKN